VNGLVSNDKVNVINDLTGKIDRGERPRTGAEGGWCPGEDSNLRVSD